MNCPHCNKPMKILVRPDAFIFPDGKEFVKVLGRCDDCDFDAEWSIYTLADGSSKECHLKQYFFG